MSNEDWDVQYRNIEIIRDISGKVIETIPGKVKEIRYPRCQVCGFPIEDKLHTPEECELNKIKSVMES